MAIYQRPGVYVEETLNPIAPVVTAESVAVAAFIGASDQGPIEPTVVNSWSQYKNLFGGWNRNNGNTNFLPLAVWMFFQNGGSMAYVQRVLSDFSLTPAHTTLNDDAVSPAASLTVSAISPGSWGNSVSISISDAYDANRGVGDPDMVYDIAVYSGGVTAAYSVERYSAVSNVSTNDRFVEHVVNSSSGYITVTALTENHPAATGTTPVTLSSGTDGEPVTESMISGEVSKFDSVRNSLILNAAGVYTPAYVNELISYAEGRADVFVVVDTGPGTPDDQISLASSYTPSSHAAVYYPSLVVNDPTNPTRGTTATISAAGAVLGLYAATDISRGVFKSPAGQSARIAGAVSIASLSNAELDALNVAAAPVNAIRYIPGSGIVVMGARTLKGGYADRYISVRRTLIYLRKALSDLTEFAVFEPNDSRLWRDLTDICSKFLTSFWQSGGLRGDEPEQAFFVKCDEDINTLSSIDAGEVNIEIGVALQRPAEYVIIKIGQFEGGTTVTVA